MTSSAHARPGIEADLVLDDLVQRAQRGDLPAFNSIVLRFQDAVYSLALRMLASPPAAEDVTQETFIAAGRRIDTFRGGSFRSWLFTIAANRARDELRRGVRRPTTSRDAYAGRPERPAAVERILGDARGAGGRPGNRCDRTNV